MKNTRRTARSTLCLGVTILAFLLYAQSATAAKGIIKNTGGDGSGGSIIVTEGDSSSPGGSREPAPARVSVGNTLPFTEVVPPMTDVGDLVSFTVSSSTEGSALATGVAKIADGTLYTGAAGDLEVDGGVVTVLDAEAGTVDVEGAVQLTVINSTLTGELEAEETVTVVIVGNTINGDVEVAGCSALTLTGNVISGDVGVENCRRVTIAQTRRQRRTTD